MKLKILNVPGYSGTIDIETDYHGTPVDKFWRNRLKDAAIDGCVEIVTSKRKVKKDDDHTPAQG